MLKNILQKLLSKQDDSHLIAGPASKCLSAFLEAMGKLSFPIDDSDPEAIKKKFSMWADHIQNATPISSSMVQDGQKDWKGAEKFFLKHRKKEHTFVVTRFSDLKTLIWDVLASVGHNFATDHNTNTEILTKLQSLKKKSKEATFEELKTEVEQTVSAIHKLNEEKKSQWQQEFIGLGRKLRLLRTELSQAKKAMQTDALTRLYNRGAFDEQIGRIGNLSLFSGKAASIVMLDIDKFKAINDTKGHPAGDAVIREVGKALIGQFPRKNDFVARYGGEEFVVIFEEDDLKTAALLAERFRKKIEQLEIIHQEEVIKITISAGVAEFRTHETIESWISRADKALYQAKSSGRNKVCSSDSTE